MNYNQLAAKEVVDRTVKALNSKNILTVVAKNGKEALNEIKKIIPQGASLMNGASKTLEQIGFLEYLKSGEHNWNDLHAKVFSENDPVKRLVLRKQATLSDFYLGSVNALTESGEFIVASATGSQLPQIVYTSPNLIFVVSTKKIVSNMNEAIERLEKHVVPLEDKNMREKFGIGTSLNKIVIFKNENPRMGRKVHLILVEEDLGY